MKLGTNIAYLRRQKKLSQDQLAEQMNVSRQTIYRWEADEIVPELDKLVDLCSLFSCSLDNLVRHEFKNEKQIYSEVRIEKVAAFKMASYVIISPNPEEDVIDYMDRWALKSGLKTSCPNVKLIGWDFPFVSQEQEVRFGIHGYVAAYVLPKDFKTDCPGVQYAENTDAFYAVVTITDPFIQPFDRIPKAYNILLDYLKANNFKKQQPQDNVLSCFEYQCVKNGISYMDVYVHVNGATKATSVSQFS